MDRQAIIDYFLDLHKTIFRYVNKETKAFYNNMTDTQLNEKWKQQEKIKALVKKN